MLPDNSPTPPLAPKRPGGGQTYLYRGPGILPVTWTESSTFIADLQFHGLDQEVSGRVQSKD